VVSATLASHCHGYPFTIRRKPRSYAEKKVVQPERLRLNDSLYAETEPRQLQLVLLAFLPRLPERICSGFLANWRFVVSSINSSLRCCDSPRFTQSVECLFTEFSAVQMAHSATIINVTLRAHLYVFILALNTLP